MVGGEGVVDGPMGRLYFEVVVRRGLIDGCGR